MWKLFLLFFFAAALLGQNPNPAKFPDALATDQDLLVAKDQSASTLSAGIGAADTEIPVADGSRFAGYEVVTIGMEQILICSVSSNTLNVCSGGRGFAGTAAAAHNAGASVRGHITAWHHNQVAAEVKAVQSQLGANLTNVVKSADATPANTPNKVVQRDANGDFAARFVRADAVRWPARSFKWAYSQFAGADPVAPTPVRAVELPEDQLCFKTPTAVEYWDGSAWQAWSTTGYQTALDGNASGSWNIPAAQKKFRMTFNVAAWTHGGTVLVYQDYPPREFTLTVESSSDQVAWTGRGQATFTTPENYFNVLSIDNPGGDAYLRFTLDVTTDDSFYLTALRYYTYRLGFNPYRLPFTWNFNKYLGVNTTNPSALLTLKAPGTQWPHGIRLIEADPGTNYYDIVHGGGGALFVGRNGTSLFELSAGGRVAVKSTAGTGFDLNPANSATQPAAGRPWFRIAGASSDGLVINPGAASAGLFLAHDQPGNVFLASGGGSVRVGDTTAPTEKLEVAGKVRSTTGGFVLPDGKTIATGRGNSTQVQLTAGAVTSGNCAQFNADGNLVDAGTACGGGASTTRRRYYYPAAGCGTDSSGSMRATHLWAGENNTNVRAICRNLSAGSMAYIRMADATVTSLHFHYLLPGSWTGADITMRLLWFGETGGGGSTADLEARVYCAEDGMDFIAEGQGSTSSALTVPATAYTRATWTTVLPHPAACSPGTVMLIRLIRNNSDSYTGNMGIVGMELEVPENL